MSTDQVPDDVNTSPDPAIRPEAVPHGSDDCGAPLPQRLPATLQRSIASSRNGRLARGKISSAGRAVVRCNALKHGFFAKVVPAWELLGASYLQDHQNLVNGLKDDFRPVTQMAVLLVESLAGEFMKLRRLNELENLYLFRKTQSFEATIGSIETKLEQCQHRSASDCLAELTALKTLADAFRRGAAPQVPEPRLPSLVDELWLEIAGPEGSTGGANEGLTKTAVSPARQFQPQTEQGMAAVADNPQAAVTYERHPGLIKHSVDTKDDVEAVLRGERTLPSDVAQIWINTLTRLIAKATTSLAAAQAVDTAVASLKQESCMTAIDNLSSTGIIGQHITTVQRSIERLTRLLREECGQAGERFTDVYAEPCSHETEGGAAT